MTTIEIAKKLRDGRYTISINGLFMGTITEYDALRFINRYSHVEPTKERGHLFWNYTNP